MTDELLHYSAEPFVGPVHSEAQEGDLSFKPRGLWLSVGNEWAEWCREANFGAARIVHVARVTLAPNANVLRLSGQIDLDRFTDEYGDPEQDRTYHTRFIRWNQVAEKYDGIIISPYIWARRLELMWYYGWDCASGCIWNARAIESVTPLSEYGRSSATSAVPETPPPEGRE
jgi:hypothetical protein